jgi:hypothetical protein
VKIHLSDLPVYFINLDEDTEKADNIANWLGAKGFTKIHRLPGVHDPRRGVGCALAHNQALQTLANVQTPFIVLEDDVKPWNWRNVVYLPDDTDAYYLGLSTWGLAGNKGRREISATQVTAKTWRLHNMLAAHAILYLNPDYIRWLIRATKTMIDIGTNQDKARAQTMKYWNIYGPTQAHVYQSGKHSATTKVNLAELNPKKPIDLL